MKVQVDGLADVNRAAESFAKSAADMQSTYATVARGLVPGVAGRTPVRTGTLAGSWVGTGEGDAAAVTSPLPYAGAIEYGWRERHIAPARMVRDTVAAEQGQIVDTLSTDLEKAGRRAGFGT